MKVIPNKNELKFKITCLKKRKITEISKIELGSDGNYSITPVYLFDKEREQFVLISKAR